MAKENEQPADLQQILDLLKKQGEEIKNLKAEKTQGPGLDQATVTTLLNTIKLQGEQLKSMKEQQEAFHEQWEKDMASGVPLATVPYEDIAARQEREAEALALMIHPTTHQAATGLLKKIRNKLTGNAWDHIAEGMVRAYVLGKENKVAEYKAMKDELETIVVDARTSSGLFRTGRKLQSTIWPEVFKALELQNKRGAESVGVKK